MPLVKYVDIITTETVSRAPNMFVSAAPFACPKTSVNGTSRKSSSQEKDNETLKNKDEKKLVNGNMVISDSQDSENTPLVNRLKALAAKDIACFHFPGHNRGRAAPSSLSSVIGIKAFNLDTTTVPQLDNLNAPEGPILEAQKNAAKVFGAKETWFLIGGTTSGIQAAIMATCSPGDTLIIQRNSHKSAFSGMVLCGAIPKYINAEYDLDWDMAWGITPSQVEKAMNELDAEGRKASVVFITSPTYHGICSNLEQISALCHSRNIPLIVDEAHGAHLRFHETTLHLSALHHGADISVQSTHKVLGSLTQSSMLHMSGNIVDRERICKCLETLQSTSPSFLLLASLDAATAQISEHPKTIFNNAVELALDAKGLIEKIPGITVLKSSTFETDPLRITVGVWKLGISGFEVYKILVKDYGVVAELDGTRCIIFVANLGTNRDDITRLVSGLKHISQTSKSHRVNEIQPLIETNPSMRLSPRDAFFASKKRVRFEECVGKVCGELICPYPPGIPLLTPGEDITEEALKYLMEVKNNGGYIYGVSDSTLSTMVVCT